MAEQEAVAAPAGGNGAPGPSPAMKAVVDEFLGESGGGAAQAPKDEPVAAEPAKPEAPAAAAPVVQEDDGPRRDFQAFAQAQERWGRERARLAEESRSSGEKARREVLEAL